MLRPAPTLGESDPHSRSHTLPSRHSCLHHRTALPAVPRVSQSAVHTGRADRAGEARRRGREGRAPTNRLASARRAHFARTRHCMSEAVLTLGRCNTPEQASAVAHWRVDVTDERRRPSQPIASRLAFPTGAPHSCGSAASDRITFYDTVLYARVAGAPIELLGSPSRPR